MKEKSPQTTTASYFKAMRTIHLAMAAGQIGFAGVAAMLIYTKSFEPVFQLADTVRFFIAAIIVAIAVMHLLVYKSLLEKCRRQQTVAERLNTYRTALIVKYAMLEGSSLLALVAFLLTGDALFLGVAGCLIMYFLLQRPAPYKAAQEIQLSDGEQLDF